MQFYWNSSEKYLVKIDLNDIYCVSEIHIRLPENVTSKNLKVNIAYSSMEVNAIVNGERTKILGGQLYDKCKAPDAMWTITGGNKLNISVGECILTA